MTALTPWHGSLPHESGCGCNLCDQDDVYDWGGEAYCDYHAAEAVAETLAYSLYAREDVLGQIFDGRA